MWPRPHTELPPSMFFATVFIHSESLRDLVPHDLRCSETRPAVSTSRTTHSNAIQRLSCGEDPLFVVFCSNSVLFKKILRFLSLSLFLCYSCSFSSALLPCFFSGLSLTLSLTLSRVTRDVSGNNSRKKIIGSWNRTREELISQTTRRPPTAQQESTDAT